MKLTVIAVAYERVIPLRILIDSFLLQTNTNWEMTIVYDGKAPESVLDILNLYNDLRLVFVETPTRNGLWGHPNRREYLSLLPPAKDYVLLTNDDNYYVPRFVELMLEACGDNVGIVMCDTVHSHYNYNLHKSFPREGNIDMGAFIVRQDVAVTVGFNHSGRGADGKYAEDCYAYCNANNLITNHIQKPIFIHN